MSYTPTNWQTGDTITAEKLNKMEGGIEYANVPPYNTDRNVTINCTIDAQTGEITAVPTIVLTAEVQAKIWSGEYNVVCVFGTQACEMRVITDTGGFAIALDGVYCDLTPYVFRPFRLRITQSNIKATWLDTFIVTLTPTAQDFSGTMDKTVAEINEAYTAGQKIAFRVILSATEYMDIDCTARYVDGDSVYPSFNAFVVINAPMQALIFIGTGVTDDGTDSDYSTTIYPLTPMS